MAFWHRNGARVHSVNNPASVGTIAGQDDEQVFVHWDPPYGQTWEMIDDLEPDVNHPINPTAHMLTDLWLDSMTDLADDAPARDKYFECLNAARLTPSLGHLACVALLLFTSAIVKPMRVSWKARNR